MAINLVVIQVNTVRGGSKSITYAAYFSSTYTNNPAGDNIDFTATTNPDGSARNPSGFAGAFPAQMPSTWYDNGGDMNVGQTGGATIQLQFAGKTLPTCRARVFGTNGVELASAAAYSTGAPASAAVSNMHITIVGPVGKF